jgi:hypothetical protein
LRIGGEPRESSSLTSHARWPAPDRLEAAGVASPGLSPGYGKARAPGRARASISILAPLAVCAAALSAAGCRRDPAPSPIVVAVTPSTAHARAGASVRLQAAVTGGASGPVAWWVREAGGCGAVTQEGLWTAPPMPPPTRVCHVVATSHDGARSATAAIEVDEPDFVIREGSPPAGGHGRRFVVSPPAPVSWSVAEVEDEAPARPVFPLRVASSGRYLEDQGGRPFRVQADAAWFMSTSATLDEVEAYLALRQAQGFNAFYLMAMVHAGDYADIPHAPGSSAGDPPFREPGVFATPNEPYWRWIDFIVDRAARRGLAVMLAYTYLGYQGGPQGWSREVLRQPSADACYRWGLWLGSRYKAKANVVWFALGDYTPPPGSEGARRVRRIIDGIKAAGATQLFMAEMSPPDTLPSDVPDLGAAIDQNSFYGYGPQGSGFVYETADRAWAVTPPRPAWQQEGIYEFDPNVKAFTGAPWETRRARLWSALAGGTAGDGFGSRDTYKWVRFPASLFSPGAGYSTVAFRLFGSLPWWRLRPSGTRPGYAGRDLVLAGGGTRGTPDYVTSALAEGGSHLLAYVPPTGVAARAITVDLTALSAPARARWFNPATGAWTGMAAGPAGAAPATFTTPGDNGTGANDWVLVLDTPRATPAGRCGTISQSGLYTPGVAREGASCEVTAVSRSDASVVARLRL